MNYFDELFFRSYVGNIDEIETICHKHMVFIIDTILVWVTFFVLLPAFFYGYDTMHVHSYIPLWAFEAYLFVIYILLVYRIFDWYNDVWIATTSGVIDVEWSLWHRRTKYIEYHDIRSVTIDSEGASGQFLHYGTVTIRTHDENLEFVLENADHPERIADHINNIVDDIRSHNEEEEKAPFEQLLETLKDVVRDHLKKPHETQDTDTEPMKDTETIEAERELNRAKRRRGTVDLRGR